MSTLVIETKITHKYLMNKSKWELADMYLQLLDSFDKLQKESGSVCGSCGGWLKGGECENCASPTVGGPTPVAADNATLPACEHVFIAADNYARCVSCGAPRYR